MITSLPSIDTIFITFLISAFFYVFPLLQPDPAAAAANQANREEVDSRSIFVGNVRLLHQQVAVVLKEIYI